MSKSPITAKLVMVAQQGRLVHDRSFEPNLSKAETLRLLKKSEEVALELLSSRSAKLKEAETDAELVE